MGQQSVQNTLQIHLWQDVDVEDRTHFSLITPRTAAPHVLVLLLPYADHDLDDTDWVVARMKADCSSHNPSDGEPAHTGTATVA